MRSLRGLCCDRAFFEHRLSSGLDAGGAARDWVQGDDGPDWLDADIMTGIGSVWRERWWGFRVSRRRPEVGSARREVAHRGVCRKAISGLRLVSGRLGSVRAEEGPLRAQKRGQRAHPACFRGSAFFHGRNPAAAATPYGPRSRLKQCSSGASSAGEHSELFQNAVIIRM